MDYINRWLGSELLMFCILPWGYAAAVALLLILMFSKKRSRLWGGDQFRTEFVHLKSTCSP
ncbi:hypothetical protein LJN20_004078 [Salmonella enterica]|nr:hypothetical protein [Salmonella enterica]